jgi:hypothetical protein
MVGLGGGVATAPLDIPPIAACLVGAGLLLCGPPLPLLLLGLQAWRKDGTRPASVRLL